MFSRLLKAMNSSVSHFGPLLLAQMTYFPTLLYTSTREISTLLYIWSLKKIPLSGEASQYNPSEGVPPPPKTQSVACLFAKKIKENLLQVQRRRKNAHFCGIEPLLAYLWGQTIQAEKNKPPKIFFTIRILENKVSKRFALRTDFNLRAIDGSLTSNTYKEKGLEQMPFCQFIPKQHLTF